MKTDNELIAEFMGDKPNPYGLLWYHESWNWLMPVVNKIDKLYHETFPGNEEFIRRILAKEDPLDGPYMDVIALPLATPIDEVHQAVVSFIKWHNENKQ